MCADGLAVVGDGHLVALAHELEVAAEMVTELPDAGFHGTEYGAFVHRVRVSTANAALSGAVTVRMEFAITDIDWFNHRRLHGENGEPGSASTPPLRG